MRWRAWLAIGATAVGIYLVGRWQGAAGIVEAAVTRDAQTAVSSLVRHAYLAKISALTLAQQQEVARGQMWRHRADSLRTLALHADTVTISDSGPISLWRATANAERAGAQQCALALASCAERAQTAEARAQALDTLLDHVLRVKDCHVLWVRCPSRVATGLLGFGLGVAGGRLIR